MEGLGLRKLGLELRLRASTKAREAWKKQGKKEKENIKRMKNTPVSFKKQWNFVKFLAKARARAGAGPGVRQGQCQGQGQGQGQRSKKKKQNKKRKKKKKHRVEHAAV